MNVFILIGLIMSCFGIAIIIITACILTLIWGIKAADEYKKQNDIFFNGKRESGDE